MHVNDDRTISIEEGTTGITYAERTCNPVKGCSWISPGCDNCYAREMAYRLRRMGKAKYADGFAVRTHPAALDEPLRVKKPCLFFVGSMGDNFHEEVPLTFLHEQFAVMRECPQHVFMMLTKRPARMLEFSESIGWPRNVWAGATIEHNDYVFRADILREVPAPVRFISYEPALGPLPDLDLRGIDLVIMGGESGPRFRPMDADWAREMRDRCIASGVAFHFKQWSGVRPKALGRELDGVVWDEMPRIIDGGAAA